MMNSSHRRALVALIAAVSLSVPAGAVLPRPEPPGGAVPASASNVELVGSIQLTEVPGGIADVSALGSHAYLAAWGGECFAPHPGNPQSQGPGIHVVDFSIPQLPRKVAFIPAPKNAYVGEGVAVQHIQTRSFRGDLLLVSHEPCDSGSSGAGGISLYDVTDPSSPRALALGAGDRSPKPRGGRSAHPSHSAFLWQQGSRAYVVAVDNEESSFRDVDIFEVTNPRKPKLIAETGLPYWRRVNRGAAGQKALGGDAGSFHHDVWVRKVGKDWLMLVSYWDTGWVVLNVNNPAKPRYLRDFNYPKKDKLTRKPTEGNAHQAVFSSDGRYIIGTNEDLFAKFTIVAGRRGSKDWEWFDFTQELPRAIPIPQGLPGVGGPTIYGGLGCPPLGIPSPSTVGGVPPGDIPVVVLQEGGSCDTSTKLNAAAAVGYRMAILVSSHETSRFGTAPTAVTCSRPPNAVHLSVVCLSHARLHRMFDATMFAGNVGTLHYVDPFLGEPKVGDRGDLIRAVTFADGTWGDLNLVDARSMKLIDQHQIREGLDRNCLEGCGSLSVHEVKLDPRAGTNLVYASWYGGGMRAFTYGPKGLREVGHYTDGAQDYWGVMPVPQASGPPLVLMSDMNYGLTILRYTG